MNPESERKIMILGKQIFLIKNEIDEMNAFRKKSRHYLATIFWNIRFYVQVNDISKPGRDGHME